MEGYPYRKIDELTEKLFPDIRYINGYGLHSNAVKEAALPNLYMALRIDTTILSRGSARLLLIDLLTEAVDKFDHLAGQFAGTWVKRPEVREVVRLSLDVTGAAGTALKRRSNAIRAAGVTCTVNTWRSERGPEQTILWYFCHYLATGYYAPEQLSKGPNPDVAA